MINDDGDIVYPGDGDATQRTGSNVAQLMHYLLLKDAAKPLDVDEFRNLLVDVFKIPPIVFAYQPWKRYRY